MYPLFRIGFEYSQKSNRSSKNTQEQVVKVNLTVEADVQYWTDCKSPAASSCTIWYKFTLFCCFTTNKTFQPFTLFILYEYHVFIFLFSRIRYRTHEKEVYESYFSYHITKGEYHTSILVHNTMFLSLLLLFFLYILIYLLILPSSARVVGLLQRRVL